MFTGATGLYASGAQTPGPPNRFPTPNHPGPIFPRESVPAMNAPGSPRFRFRTSDGREVPVASVADLSARVEAGEVGPETPLFDAGTGRWDRSGDVPVFQFVVEELRAEGRLPEALEDSEIVVRPDPPPETVIDPGKDFEPIRHEVEPSPDAGAVSRGPSPEKDATVRVARQDDAPGAHVPGSDGSGREPPAGGEAPLLDVDRLPEGGELTRSAESGDDEIAPGVTFGEPTPDPFELHLPLSTRHEGGAPTEGSGAPADGGEARDPGDSPGEEEPREPWFEDRHQDSEPDGGPGSPEEGEGGSRETGAEAPGAPTAPTEEALAEDPGSEVELDSSPLHTWLTHGPPPPGRSAAGAAESAPGGAVGAEASPFGPPMTSMPGPGESAASPPPPPLDIRTAWEDDDTLDDPRALHLAIRRRKRNARIMAGGALLLLAAVAGVAAWSVLQPVDSDAGAGSPGAAAPTATGPGAEGRELPDPATAGELPPGLEEEATRLWAALPAEVARRINALRVESDLPEAPPREWLGGFYLANAGQFPGVVEFWEGYRDYVRRVAEEDADLILEATREVLEREFGGEETLAAGARERLEAFVLERQGRSGAVRQDRYTHLERTAVASLALHDFLVENGEAITYTPALGRGVSADPVLEAVTDSPEVQRQLERHLDRVFEALDRTRGGGPPSLAGLRAELFGSLGRPL